MTDDMEPLYELFDRRCSGEWRVIGTFTDPQAAQRVADLLRSAGGDVKLELIPTPLIP